MYHLSACCGSDKQHGNVKISCWSQQDHSPEKIASNLYFFATFEICEIRAFRVVRMGTGGHKIGW